jgi:hypothetical protein
LASLFCAAKGFPQWKTCPISGCQRLIQAASRALRPSRYPE